MRKNRLLVALTATVVTLTTWWAVPSTAAPERTEHAVARAADPPPISWGPCTDATLQQVGAQCGFVTVPMDYANPSGEKIQLAVSRVQHTTPTSQGVMLVNPGGPGGSGLVFAALGKVMPLGSGAGYDWIGFDPRGVGSSKPAMSCRPFYFHANRPPYVPANPAQVQVWLGRSRDYARSCAKYGALLDHMKTVDSVRDMDEIRKALGESRINFYGYSYGTYLAQVYATLFPDRVRRMVLDSNVDPTTWGRPESGTAQTLAFERVFHVFFRWIARHNATYHLGRTAAAVQQQYLKQRRYLRNHPANRVLGASEWDDAFELGGYLQAAWPLEAQGFADWVHRRNPRMLIALWRFQDTPGNDNTYAAFNAVNCTDAPTPGVGTYLADARRLYQVAPLFTWSSAWFSAPCLYWPARPGTPVSVTGNDVGMLLVGQTLDAATPFPGSLEVRSLFPNSRLIGIRGGTTHGSTPDLSGACASARVAAYLKTGFLPPRQPGRTADIWCAAPPQPKPTTGPAGRGGARGLLTLERALTPGP